MAERVDYDTGEVTGNAEYLRMFPSHIPFIFGATGNVLLLLLRTMRFGNPRVYVGAWFVNECAEHGISRSSVHRALGELAKYGIVTRGRGYVEITSTMFYKGKKK